jgi:cytidylate kinase
LNARIVTISATYGAGGSVIAPALAERLGLPFADRLIPARGTLDAAGEGLSDEEREEMRRRGFLSRLAHLTGGMGLPVPDAGDLRGPVRAQVESHLRTLAESGGAVVLGRGAQIALAAEPMAYHVRLDGPPERRCERAMAFENIDASTAHDRLEETDRARARYLVRLYDHDPSDPALYHLVLDSTVLASDVCVDIVATAATSFWSLLDG